MKKTLTVMFVCLLLGVLGRSAGAHCEIPCGIYDDQLRVGLMHEHITTIEKSMVTIKELTADEDKNYNQIVRWINNKEKHAEELQHIVTQYFMTQRIKAKNDSESPGWNTYTQQLTLLHKMLVHAKNAKAGTDTNETQKLHDLLDSFKASYFGGGKGSPKGSAKGSDKGSDKNMMKGSPR